MPDFSNFINHFNAKSHRFYLGLQNKTYGKKMRKNNQWLVNSHLGN